MTIVDNIWRTFEMHCVAADLTYDNDYLRLHKEHQYQHSPLSEAGYNKLKELFDIELEHPAQRDFESRIAKEKLESL